MKRKIRRLANSATQMITSMMSPVLLPDEKKDFVLRVLHITNALVESCMRHAGRERIRKSEPSLN